MVEINLLPWRQRQRRRKKYALGSMVVVVMGLILLGWIAWPAQTAPETLPPPKRLASASPLLRWRYVGYLQIEHQFIGLLAAPDGQTHAVTKGLWLPAAAATIMELNQQHIVLKQSQHACITLILVAQPTDAEEVE